jgi:hypothetical protein
MKAAYPIFLTQRRISIWEHPGVVLNVDIDEEFLGQR